jgi:Spy/CpxP family protein refolding chaperone
MKARTILAILAISMSSLAHAQQRTGGPSPSPQAQQDLQQRLETARTQLEAAQPQRGRGGRGAPVDPSTLYLDTVNQYRLRVLNAPTGANFWGGGAWWTNTELVTRLGLSDDQKTKIERAFENHRQSLASSSELVDKEEAKLAMLLQADTIDRNAIFTQIDHVIQARAELERANATMSLEMREVLTKAQWTQLQSQPQWLGGGVSAIRLPGAVPAGRGERSGGGRGQRQQ